MGLRWYKAVWKDPSAKELTSGPRLLLMALADFANDVTGECWPDIATLADMISVTERQVKRLLRTLEEKGLIETHISVGRNKTNRYKLMLKGDTSVTINDAEKVTYPSEKVTWMSPFTGQIDAKNGVTNDGDNRKGDMDVTPDEPEKVTDMSPFGVKHDIHVTFCDEKNMTPASPFSEKKVTYPSEKVTYPSVKGDMDVTRSIKNHQEPSSSARDADRDGSKVLLMIDDADCFVYPEPNRKFAAMQLEERFSDSEIDAAFNRLLIEHQKQIGEGRRGIMHPVAYMATVAAGLPQQRTNGTHAANVVTDLKFAEGKPW